VVIGPRDQVVTIDHHTGGAVSVTLHLSHELACPDRVHLNVPVISANQNVPLFLPLIKIKDKYLITIELIFKVFWNLGIVNNMA